MSTDGAILIKARLGNSLRPYIEDGRKARTIAALQLELAAERAKVGRLEAAFGKDAVSRVLTEAAREEFERDRRSPGHLP